MFDTVWFGWKQNARLKQGEEKFLSAFGRLPEF